MSGWRTVPNLDIPMAYLTDGARTFDRHPDDDYPPGYWIAPRPRQPVKSDRDVVRSRIESLAPRVLFKFDMTPREGSNVWPDLDNPFLRPLRFSVCPVSGGTLQGPVLDSADATTRDTHDFNSASSSSSGYIWPLQCANRTNLPAELYMLICSHLSMEDAKALRLTCKEIEQYVSPILFESIVVPFHMSIFQNARPCMPSDTGKEKESVVVDVDLFHNHGKNIKSFGIRFEIPEVVLAVPPSKELLSSSSTYWGRYNWPSSCYPRFDRMKDLEGLADDGSAVREALSTLFKVEELAVSVDNSLGWLAGPDKSIRDQLLVEREPIIQSSFLEPSRKSTAYRKIWDFIDAEFGLFDDRVNLYCSTLHVVESKDNVSCEEPETQMQFFSRRILWEALGRGSHRPEVPMFHSGYLAVSQHTASQRPTVDQCSKTRNHPIIPNRLSPRQIELLLENWWAQHAFLTSFVVSVIDTLPSSAHVKTLNIDRLSADFMDLLCRSDFWAALPHLRTVKVFVIGQFRQITKDDLETADCTDVRPSRAAPKFRELLENYIAPIKNIKELAFGWASGGENEKGMYGRNMFLLPAPFLSYEPTARRWIQQVDFDSVISFPFVEELRVKNCWMTAEAIAKLVLNKENRCLRKLSLDSVSLLGYRIPPDMQQFYNFPVGGLHLPTVDLGAAPNRPQLLPFERSALFWGGHRPIPGGFTIRRAVDPEAWSGVLDRVSPGTNLSSVGAESDNAFRDDLALQELELISCGYCALHNEPFRYEDLDRSFKQGLHANHLTGVQASFVKQRSMFLERLMMTPHDAGLAEIIQVIPLLDEYALTTVFEARIGPLGFPSPQQAAFDHRLPGGSGRFSTVLRRESELDDELETFSDLEAS